MSENVETAASAAPSPELTIVDLQNIRSIIDVAAKRGAFGAGEMAAIGGVYNKLEAFLNAVAPQQAPEESASEAPATE